MSSDYFSLSLETPSGVVLPSIEYDSQRWFVGEPGQEFVVAVTMINNSQKTYRVRLSCHACWPCLLQACCLLATNPYPAAEA